MNILRGQTNAIEFPLTLGREFCGILLQKGMKVNNTKDLQLGERVWGVVPLNRAHGSHAECVVVPDYCVNSSLNKTFMLTIEFKLKDILLFYRSAVLLVSWGMRRLPPFYMLV